MSIYAIYEYSSDNSGHEEVTGPDRYVEANSEEEVREIFPEGFYRGFILKEIQIETVAWIKIQRQILG